MMINPSALLGASAPPEPLIAPPSPQPGTDFASLLAQTVQAAPPPPAPMPPTATATAAPIAPPAAPMADSSNSPGNTGSANPTDGSDTTPADANGPTGPTDPSASSTAAASRAAAKARPTAGSANPAARAAADKASSDQTKAADERGKADSATPATGAVDPNLAQWLAQLQQPPETTRGTRSGASGDSLGGAADDDARAVGGKGGAEAGSTRDIGLGDSDSPLAANPGVDPAVAETAFAEIQSAARGAENSRSGRIGATDASSAAAAMGLAAPAPATQGAQASAPVAVTVATPVDAPEFPQVLGVHLSVLAKDGVQQAELHLNPTDMGPVSVQIAVEGTQARIDFGADAAATRHAIEAGLPELAGALRDAGFTLTGGGVSQHSRGQSGDGGSGARGESRGSGSGGAVAAATGVRRNVAVGGVDLYA